MIQGAPKLDALTGVRGLAAWLVVFYHIRAAFGGVAPDGLIAGFAKGYLAVDLFFVLSGFVLWLNYGRRFAAEGLRAAPGFLVRRVARIYPLHLAVLAATVAYAGALALTGRTSPDQYPLADLPLHALLIQNWGLTSTLAWNDPAWSISTEMAAYLLLPAVGALLWRRMPPPALCGALAVVLAIALGFILDARGAAILDHDIPANGLIRCLFEFFIGVLTCMAWQRNARPAGAALGVAGGALAIGIAWAAGWIGEVFAAPMMFAGLVFALASSSGVRGNPFASRPVVWLGEISYSTYLVHFLLWDAFKLLFVADPAAVPVPLIAAFLALTLAASALLYRLIEVPGRRFVQQLASRPLPTTQTV
jgi:peptidoglycan/LPS O-acetylase OafA/YrhL